ncbi:MAG: hypothetical protein DRP29_01895 [Thermodesulfobacteriota bacterium]|nr:MAG: hypothetical protein DRP29_01895 [Thermodesulfobacteriota bacterium]
MFTSAFIKEVFKELISNKINLFFMLLALIISLTALNTIYSLGLSAKQQILENLANLQFGKDALLVIAGGGKLIGLTTTRSDTLKVEDAEAISKLDFVLIASPISIGTLEVSYKGQVEKLRVQGVLPNYTIANNWYPQKGRFINERDIKTLAKVCVVGAYLPEKFHIKNPIGKKLKIQGQYYTIVGVLEPKAILGHFRRDERVLLPLTTAQRRVFNRDWISAIKFVFKPNTDMKLAVEKIRKILRTRHKLYGIQPDDFRIITPEMAIEVFTKTSRTISVFLITISLISLIISGVIIMNLMYSNIEEKASIIALRIALGAKENQIILHYLLMATFIALISGIIGWLLSIVFIVLITHFTPLKAYFSFYIFLFSLTFAFITCILFSLIPAIKAAKIEPALLLKNL